MSFKNQEICTLGSRSKILIIKMWGASKSFQFIRWRTKLTLDLEDEILGETRLEAPKVVYDCCCWKKFMQIYSRSLHSIMSSHCVTFFRIVIFFFTEYYGLCSLCMLNIPIRTMRGQGAAVYLSDMYVDRYGWMKLGDN